MALEVALQAIGINTNPAHLRVVILGVAALPILPVAVQAEFATTTEFVMLELEKTTLIALIVSPHPVEGALLEIVLPVSLTVEWSVGILAPGPAPTGSAVFPDLV